MSKRFAVTIAVATATAIVGFGSTGSQSAPAHAHEFSVPIHATIAYAVDGDTLRVSLDDGDLEYVRLVGIDTPEDVRPGYPTECGAEAAVASMERLAPEGVAVTLRPDSVVGETDRYGRLLAHAIIDGRQLELAQLRRGLAYLYRYEDQRFDGLSRFEAAQGMARRQGRGVWVRCDGDFHSAEPGTQN